MPFPDPPPDWGNDEISKFIDHARGNEFATFANLKDEAAYLIEIDLLFRVAVDALNHSKDWFAGFFVLRAHSNFLAACRLVWSGQIPETYELLRSCLENALYCLYLAKNPDSRETWLRRHDNEDTKKAVRAEFKIGTLLDLASAVAPAEGPIARKLYDRSIDYGAHPNERALMQSLKIIEGVEQIKFQVIYQEHDSVQLRFALKTTAEFGICALSLIQGAYQERFAILGMADELTKLKKGK